eukprot:NODE_147_length_17537_cov_0.265627.p14 type:complete len:146 gc:universal NODE_147_length_17537_cov_0.265627:4097-3660(-)
MIPILERRIIIMEKVAVGILSIAALYRMFYYTNELPVLSIDIETLIWSKNDSIALIENVQAYIEYLKEKYQVYIMIAPNYEEFSSKFPNNSIVAPKISWMPILLQIKSKMHIESDRFFGEHLTQITNVVYLSDGKFVDLIKKITK